MTRSKEVRQTWMQKTDDYIHIETEGCIINIRPGLKNALNQCVTSIEILADGKDQCDPVVWAIDD